MPSAPRLSTNVAVSTHAQAAPTVFDITVLMVATLYVRQSTDQPKHAHVKMVALRIMTVALTSALQEVLPFVTAAIVNVSPRATRILIVPSLSRVRPGRCHIAHHRINTLVNA